MNKVIHRNFFVENKTIRIIIPLFILFFSFFIYSNTYADVSYSITYDSSVVTDMPTDSSNKSLAEEVPIASNHPSYPHHIFLGWCSTTPTNVDGTDTCPNGTTYQPENSLAIDQTGSNNDFHLYAMWEDGAGALLDTGANVNAKIKTLAAGTSKTLADSTSDIKAIRMADSLPSGFTPSADNTVSDPDSALPIYAFYDNTNSAGILYFYTEGDEIIMNPTSSHLFRNNTALTDISGIADWKANNVKTLLALFNEDSSLSDISALSNWNTSSVTDIGWLFAHDSAITNLSSLSRWDTRSVTSMHGAFGLMTSLSNISGLANWNVAKVEDMAQVFYGDTAVSDCSPLTNWDTKSATTLKSTFDGVSIESLSFATNWNVSNVTDMRQTFARNPSLKSLTPLANWDVSKVTNMISMFNGDYSITDISAINDWDITSVIAQAGSSSDSTNQFYTMFYNCPAHPTFTKRAGTWNGYGTFIPSS